MDELNWKGNHESLLIIAWVRKIEKAMFHFEYIIILDTLVLRGLEYGVLLRDAIAERLPG